MSASSRIENLVKTKLAGRRIDVVGFIDALLEIAAELGEVRCCLADERRLRFELGGDETCEVEVDSSRGKLRMLCARLGILCMETPGSTVSLYGGEGSIRAASKNGTGGLEPNWTVRLKNTPAEHEFTISLTKAENPANAARRTSVS